MLPEIEASAAAGKGLRNGFFKLRAVVGWGGALLMAAGSLTFYAACGGTNGHEDLPMTAAGSVDATLEDASDDVSDDLGFFDVDIQYADQVLPDVVAPPDGGDAEAGSPFPSCPPFIPVNAVGAPVPLAIEDHESPSAYDDAGAIELAPDGSVCQGYGWLGSTSIDSCTTEVTGSGFIQLPPCNWCSDAGIAVQGSGAGVARYQLCMDLYACIAQSGCGPEISSCLCGTENTVACSSDSNPPGPCASQEMASLEELTGSTLDALMNYTALDPSFLGICGSRLNAVYANGASGDCFPPDAGSN